MRAHQQNAAADANRLGNRVRDEQHRKFRLVPQLQQLFLHLGARKCIERGERLVHQQDLRLHGHRAGDCHALLHSARKRVGIARSELGQVHLGDIVHGAFFSLTARQCAAGGQRKYDILPHGFPGQKLVEFLEDEHAIRSGTHHLGALQPGSVQCDASLRGLDISADCFEQGRFAASRRPQHHEPVRPVKLEADAVGGRDEMLFGSVAKRHAFYRQKRSRHRISFPERHGSRERTDLSTSPVGS